MEYKSLRDAGLEEAWVIKMVKL